MAIRISYAFAENGDKNTVPDTSVGTDVSFEFGWPAAYSLPDTDPGYRFIDRDKHNYLMNVLSGNIKEWQDQSFPEFNAVIDYPVGAVIRESGAYYQRITGSGAVASAALSSDFIPFGSEGAGFIKYFAGSGTPPGRYIKPTGAAVSRTVYANLFSVIGTIYGVGDGVTTFNLPDARGLHFRVVDDGRGLDPGRTLGSYQADMISGHYHLNGSGSVGQDPLSADPYVYGTTDQDMPGLTSSKFSETTGPAEIQGLTSVTGGSETRVKTIAFYAWMAY